MAYENIRAQAPLSVFPDGYIEVPKLTAPSSAEAALIVQYNEALSQGDYATAQQILTDNPNLNNCRITVEAYNTIIDEIKAIEMYYVQEVESMVTSIASQTVAINDSTPSATTAYSSKKIERMNHIASIPVPASGWVEDGDGYTQTVNVASYVYPGTAVTSADKPEVYYNTSNIDYADAEDYAEECSYIYHIFTGTNTLTFKAYDLPTMDIIADVKGI